MSDPTQTPAPAAPTADQIAAAQAVLAAANAAGAQTAAPATTQPAPAPAVDASAGQQAAPTAQAAANVLDGIAADATKVADVVKTVAEVLPAATDSAAATSKLSSLVSDVEEIPAKLTAAVEAIPGKVEDAIKSLPAEIKSVAATADQRFFTLLDDVETALGPDVRAEIEAYVESKTPTTLVTKIRGYISASPLVSLLIVALLGVAGGVALSHPVSTLLHFVPFL